MTGGKQDCECTQGEILKEMRKCMIRHDDRLQEGELMFQKIVIHNEAILAGQKEGQETLERFNKRLFVDNGTPSVQTKIDRHSQMLKGMMWAITSVSAIVAGVVIKLAIGAVISGSGISVIK